MDKVAFYEEMILDDVLTDDAYEETEKTAGALNRFMRNVGEVELSTGLEAKLPRLEKKLESHGIQGLKVNALRRGSCYNGVLDPHRVKDIKKALGLTPYERNTGLSIKTVENSGRYKPRIVEAIEKNNRLQEAKKKQKIVNSFKTKNPNIAGVQFG